MKRAGVFWMLCFLSGCSLGPDPEHASPQLPTPLGDLADVDGIRVAPWRQLVRSPELRRLVESALAGNADLKVAAARLQQMKARAGLADARLYPGIDANTSGGVVRLSEEENPFREVFNPDRSPMGFGLSFSWEVDWWGRIERGRQAAGYHAEAAKWDLLGLQTQVVASVLHEAIAIQTLNREIRLLKALVDLERDSLGWVNGRVERGEADRETLLEMKSRVATSEVELERLRALLDASRRGLAALCGRGELGINFSDRSGELLWTGSFLDLKAGGIRRRPDVAASLVRFRKAVAELGVAEASRWPEIQIMGRTGKLSSSFSELLGDGATSYRFGLNLRVPVFDGGAGQKRVKEAESALEGVQASHLGTVLKALREVGGAADWLNRVERIHAKVSDLHEIAVEQRQLEERRMEAGESHREPVRQRRIEELQAEVLALRERSRKHLAMVDLYRALGGGWR